MWLLQKLLQISSQKISYLEQNFCNYFTSYKCLRTERDYFPLHPPSLISHVSFPTVWNKAGGLQIGRSKKKRKINCEAANSGPRLYDRKALPPDRLNPSLPALLIKKWKERGPSLPPPFPPPHTPFMGPSGEKRILSILLLLLLLLLGSLSAHSIISRVAAPSNWPSETIWSVCVCVYVWPMKPISIASPRNPHVPQETSGPCCHLPSSYSPTHPPTRRRAKRRISHSLQTSPEWWCKFC